MKAELEIVNKLKVRIFVCRPCYEKVSGLVKILREVKTVGECDFCAEDQAFGLRVKE